MSSPGLRLYGAWRRLRRRAFTVLVRGGFRSFGRRSGIEAPAKLLGTEHISLGDDVYIGPRSWLNYLGESGEDRGIFIESGVEIAGDCVLSAALRIVIERDVTMGRYVHISDHAHRREDPEQGIVRQGLTDPAPVRIGSGTWLGQGVVVCPGVTIGRNVVVGANSVVRKDLPDGCMAAGAPAVVKRLAGS